MKAKRIIGIVLALSMTAIFAGCSSTGSGGGAQSQSTQQQSQDAGDSASSATPSASSTGDGWVFDRRIEIMIPAGAGSGLDTTMRALSPILEKELGTTIVIDNRSGSNGVTGFTFSYNQPRDGYNFQFISPSVIGSAAQGKFSVPMWDELIPVCGLVQAEAMIFAGPKAPFSNLKEMVDYVKANPGKVSVALETPNGSSGAVLKTFCDAAGLEYNWVTSESDEAIISVIAGDIDVLVGTWSDTGAYAESGDVIAICTLTEEQSAIVPDVPSSATVGAPVPLGFYRVFSALEGTPQEAIDAFVAGVMRATETEEWKSFLSSSGMSNDYRWNSADLSEILNISYTVMESLFEDAA